MGPRRVIEDSDNDDGYSSAGNSPAEEHEILETDTIVTRKSVVVDASLQIGTGSTGKCESLTHSSLSLSKTDWCYLKIRSCSKHYTMSILEVLKRNPRAFETTDGRQFSKILLPINACLLLKPVLGS